MRDATTTTVIEIPDPVRRQLEAVIAAGYPYETCGVLVGTTHGARVLVARQVQARNRNAERANDRYDLDPDDFRAADEAALADGLEIVGIWHSHPDHPARPSETDRLAAWPGWSYVIASVGEDGVTDIRSWRLDDDQQFHEETLDR